MRVFRNFIRTFKASSLGNMLTGKGILRASYGKKKRERNAKRWLLI